MSEAPHDRFGLAGKVAIVTGGSRGIGHAIAQELAAAGAQTVVASRRVSESAQAGPGAHAARLVAHEFDVTSQASIRTLVDDTVATFGRLDILVNCAGQVAMNAAFEVTEEEWDRLIDTNLKGLFFCCQAAGRVMAGQGGGRIINIASALGLVGLELRAVYGASKGGVIQLTRALAVEWAPHQITVNAIAPTTTLTGETAALYADPAAYAAKSRDIPLGRLGQPADIAAATLYLASPAAAFVTGHVLVVDGGYSVH